MMKRVRCRWQALLAAALITMSIAPRSGSAADLDVSFGTGGWATMSFGSDLSSQTAGAVAVQSDGKIVAAGGGISSGANVRAGWTWIVARYNADGSPDTSFGNAGKVITLIGNLADRAQGIALQDDGKIVVAGYSYDTTTEIGDDYNFAVVRYNSDGSLDSSFGTGGIVTTSLGRDDDAWAVAVQDDGKIIAAGTSEELAMDSGSYRLALIRYHSNGSLDTGFGSGGVVLVPSISSAQAVAVQPDGRLVTAGHAWPGSTADFALARLNDDGTLDTGFGSGGIVTTSLTGNDDFAKSLALMADGRIVVAGASHNGIDADYALARYNSDGSLDSSFGTGGKVVQITASYDYGESVAVQSNGKVVITGTSLKGNFSRAFLRRLAADGSVDAGFGGGGKVIAPKGFKGYAVTIQPDGKLVVAGNRWGAFTVARYLGDCIVDGTTCSDGNPCTQNDMCTGGVCAGAEQPALGCVVATKAVFRWRDNANAAKDSLSLVWHGGASEPSGVQQDDFGNPIQVDGYGMCVFDATGLVARAEVPGGTICPRANGKQVECWSGGEETPSGVLYLKRPFKYNDPLRGSSGIAKILLKPSGVKRGMLTDARVSVSGKGINLPGPTFPMDGPVVVQVIGKNNAFCAESTFSGVQIKKNDLAGIHAKIP